jgi:ribosomal protein L29
VPVYVAGKFAQSKQRAGRHTARSVSEQVRNCVVKQVYFGAVCVELKWFGFRDKSKELKKELGELRKTHDAVMVENTALVAEMAKKEQDGIRDTAARLEVDAEARLTRQELEEELEEQEETLLALRSELAASTADNTALEEKVGQFKQAAVTNVELKDNTVCA